MSKVLLRKLIIVSLFLIAGVLHYLGRGEWWVMLVALGFAALSVGLDTLLYSRRGIFLYALLGLVLGYYAGQLVFDIIKGLLLNAPGSDPESVKKLTNLLLPYFELVFATLGFALPFQAAPRKSYSLDLPMGGEDEKRAVEIKLLDTSVIIDGRISDIANTGFISGTLVVPKFVLNEIQALADSQDPIKRSRARRGLDVLNKLKEIHTVDLKISSRDFPDVKGVDAKLIILAREVHASIVTNDYNLNKIAKLEGIQILNLNDLANALKPILLPGEEFELEVIKEGKENNQGVGYLPDGTMVVVANGIKLIGKEIQVKVTSILQTSAGRIIFTEPKR